MNPFWYLEKLAPLQPVVVGIVSRANYNAATWIVRILSGLRFLSIVSKANIDTFNNYHQTSQLSLIQIPNI